MPHEKASQPKDWTYEVARRIVEVYEYGSAKQIERSKLERAIKTIQGADQALLDSILHSPTALASFKGDEERNKRLSYIGGIIEACNRPDIAEKVWDWICKLYGLPDGVRTQKIILDDQTRVSALGTKH